MSTPNICFYAEKRKIIPELSPNTMYTSLTIPLQKYQDISPQKNELIFFLFLHEIFPGSHRLLNLNGHQLGSI